MSKLSLVLKLLIDILTHSVAAEGEIIHKRGTELPAKNSFFVPVRSSHHLEVTVSMGGSERESYRLPIAEYTVMDIPPEYRSIFVKMHVDTSGIITFKAFTEIQGTSLDVFNDTNHLSIYEIDDFTEKIHDLYSKFESCQNLTKLKEDFNGKIYEVYSYLDFGQNEKYYKSVQKIENWLLSTNCATPELKQSITEKSMYISEILEVL